MEAPRLVYHYCTVEALMNILKTRCLRLSDVEKSNDYAERKWIQEMVAGEFCALIQEHYEMQLEFQSCLKEFVGTKNLYASCFSEKSDLLSQWRAYAMDGRGVAIGFNKTYLERLQSGKISFLKICYDLKKQRELACCHAEELYHMVAKGEKLETAVSRIYSKPEIALSVMKNPAFEEEQEWRICMSCEPVADKEEVLEKEGVRLSPIQVYYSNYRLISYYDLEFLDNKLVKEIILGPKCRLEERDIKMCLRLWGYDESLVRVLRSGATYC